MNKFDPPKKSKGQELYNDIFGSKSSEKDIEEQKPFDRVSFVANAFNESLQLDKPTTVVPEGLEEDDTFVDNLGEGLEQGTKSLLGGFAYASGQVADWIGFDEAGKKTKRVASEWMQTAPSSDDSWGQFIGNLIPSTVPTALAIASAPVSVPLAGVLGGGSLTGLGVSSAGNGMMEYEHYKQSKGDEVSEMSKLGVGVSYAAAEILFERFQLGKLMPNGLQGKILKGNIKEAEKSGRELLQVYAKHNPEGYRTLLKKMKDGFTTEGLEEVGTEIAQSVTQIMYQENDDRIETLKQLPENMKNALLGGAIMGGGLGPLSFGSQQAVNRKRRKQNGEVILAQSINDGQAYELIDSVNDGIRAIDKNGEEVILANDEIGSTVTLSLDQFDKLLQDKLDAQEVEVQKRGVKRVGQYGDEEVQIIGDDGEGGIYIQLPNGSQRNVDPEEVTDVVEISAQEQILAETGEFADQPPVLAEQVADEAEMIELPNGDFVYPEDPRYEEAKALLEQENQRAEPINIRIGKGNKKQSVNLIPGENGIFDVLSRGVVSNGELVEENVSDLTAEEVNDFAKSLEKEVNARGMRVAVQPSDPNQPFSSLEIKVLPEQAKTQAEEKSIESQYNIVLNDGKVSVINPKGEEVGSQSKYYLPKVKEFFTETAEEYADLPRVTDDDPNVTEENYLDEIGSYSENPLELSEAYLQVLEQLELAQSGSIKENAIAMDLLSSRIPSTDLDKRGIDSRIARANYTRKGADTDIAQRAEYLSDQIGQEVTIDDIVDFIREHPGGARPVLNRRPEIVGKIEERFKEVTGVNISRGLAQSMVENSMGEIDDQVDVNEKDSALEAKSESEVSNSQEESPDIEGIYNEIDEVKSKLKELGVTNGEIEAVTRKAFEYGEAEIEAIEAQIEAKATTEEQLQELNALFSGQGTPKYTQEEIIEDLIKEGYEVKDTYHEGTKELWKATGNKIPKESKPNDKIKIHDRVIVSPDGSIKEDAYYALGGNWSSSAGYRTTKRFVYNYLDNEKETGQSSTSEELVEQDNPKSEKEGEEADGVMIKSNSPSGSESSQNANIEEKEYSSTQFNLDLPEVVEFANTIPDSEVYEPNSERYGREEETHVTALYGLTTDNAEEVRKVVEGFGDFNITLGKTSVFENEEYDVLKIDVESKDLRELNKLLSSSLENENSFPDYKPHVTIAYLKPGEGKKYAGNDQFEGTKVSVSDLLFSGKDRSKTSIDLIKLETGRKPAQTSASQEGSSPSETVDELVTQEDYRLEVQSLLNRYNEGDDVVGTIQDLVDEVDALSPDIESDDVINAVLEYRSQQEYDRELSGRNDMDQAEDEFIEAIEKYISEGSDSINNNQEESAEKTQQEPIEDAVSEESRSEKKGHPRNKNYRADMPDDVIENIGKHVVYLGKNGWLYTDKLSEDGLWSTINAAILAGSSQREYYDTKEDAHARVDEMNGYKPLDDEFRNRFPGATEKEIRDFYYQKNSVLSGLVGKVSLDIVSGGKVVPASFKVSGGTTQASPFRVWFTTDVDKTPTSISETGFKSLFMGISEKPQELINEHGGLESFIKGIIKENFPKVKYKNLKEDFYVEFKDIRDDVKGAKYKLGDYIKIKDESTKTGTGSDLFTQDNAEEPTMTAKVLGVEAFGPLGGHRYLVQHKTIPGIYDGIKSSLVNEEDILGKSNDKDIDDPKALFKRTETKPKSSLKALELNDNFKNWFGDSKVVDENGDPLVVYHGTPDATFNEFREDSHFTSNPDYASIYANTAASSSGVRKRGVAPSVYPVYLSIQKPFDTRIPENKALFESEFYRKWGNGAPLSERGLPDWTDSTDLLEWIEETGKDFDGIILDEGGTPEGGWRGLSYVPLKSFQIKSAIGNNGEFSPENESILFKKSEKDIALRKIREAKEDLLKRRELSDSPLAKPKKLYRGVKDDGEGSGTSVLGRGLYTTSSKKEASEYGKVQEVDIERARPNNPIKFDTVTEFKNFLDHIQYSVVGVKRAYEFPLIPNDWVTELGFDGVQIGDSKDVTFVRLDKDLDVLFKRSDRKPSEDDLVVFHNISENKLRSADKIGGLAVPSLAITKPNIPFGKFGEISLIGGRDIVDPEVKGNRSFASDVYSPKYPELDYEITNSKKFYEVFGGYQGITDDSEHTSLSDFNDKGPEWFKYDLNVIAAYLDSKGELPDPVYKPMPEVDERLIEFFKKKGSDYDFQQAYKDQEFKDLVKKVKTEEGVEIAKAVGGDYTVDEFLKRTFTPDGDFNYHVWSRLRDDIETVQKGEAKLDRYATRDLLRDAVRDDQEGLEAWLDDTLNDIGYSEKIFDGYTPGGRRKYLPHNLDTVVKVLKRKLRSGEGFNYGVGNIRAEVAPEFKSIEGMKQLSDRLVTEEEFDSLKEEVNNEFDFIADELRAFYKYDKNAFGYLGEVAEALQEAGKRRNTVRGLEEIGFENVNEETLTLVNDFIKKLRSMPTEYFEAKIQRAVDISEFKGAVIPKNAKKYVKDILDKHGVPYAEYDSNIEGDRHAKTQEFSENFFKKEDGLQRGSITDLLNKTKSRSEKLTDYLNEQIKGWKAKDHINIVSSREDLPAGVRNYLDKYGPGSTGLYYGNSVYVMTYNIKDEKEALQTLYHETIGHFGVRGLLRHLSYNQSDFKGRLDNLAKQVVESFESDPLFKDIVDKYGFDMNVYEDRVDAAQEFIAFMAENDTEPNLVNKFIDFLNDLLKRLGLKKNLTKSDIRALLIDARRFVDNEATTFNDGVMLAAFKYENLASPFYSQMHQVLSKKLPGKGTGASFKQAVEAFDRKGQFKTEELEWSGLLEWLDEQTGKLDREDVVGFVRDNQVELEEVVKSDGGTDVNGAKHDINIILNDNDIDMEHDSLGESMRFQDRTTGEEIEYDEVVSIINENDPDSVSEFEVLANLLDDSEVLDDTQYSAHTLPGGVDYKEMLITLPNKKPMGYAQVIDTGNNFRVEEYNASGEFVGYAIDKKYSSRTEAENFKKAYERNVIGIDRPSADDYRNSHWNEPNVLAHVRFNTRDIDGKKTLFLEEVQSDWHQEGRKKGYKGDVDVSKYEEMLSSAEKDFAKAKEKVKGLENEIRELGLPSMASTTELNNFVSKNQDKYAELNAAKGERLGAQNRIDNIKRKIFNSKEAAVPDAPFKTTWHELVMKRMIRYAAENGFEKVAWTPGEVQNERYNLSKKISSIEVGSITDNKVELQVTSTSGSSVDMSELGSSENSGSDGYYYFLKEDLPDIIGKELSNKIIEGGEYKEYSGIDLSVGGEGMKGFYDKILPSFTKKYIKKWGSKVGVGQLETGEKRVNAEVYGFVKDANGKTIFKESKTVGSASFVDLGSISTEVIASLKLKIQEGSIEKGVIDVHVPMKVDDKTKVVKLEGYVDDGDQVDDFGSRLREEFNKIAITDKSQEAWSFDVTPEMIASAVRVGQPLFKVNSYEGLNYDGAQRPLHKKRLDPLQRDPHPYQLGNGKRDRFIRTLQDRFIDGKRIIAGVVEDGGKVTDKSNFYEAETLHYGKIEGKREEFENKFGKPFVEEMKRLNREKNVEYADLREFLYARHAEERNADLLERNPDKGDAQSGMTNEEAEQIMKKFRDNSTYDDLNKVAQNYIDKMVRYTLDERVSSGLISGERYGNLKKKYNYYVPLRGFEEYMDIDPTLYSGDLKMEGRSSKAGDIVSYIYAMADTAIVQGEKNKVKQSLLEFVKGNFNRKDLFKIKNVYYRETGEIDEEGKAVHVPVLNPKIDDILDGKVKQHIDYELETTLWNDNTNPHSERQVTVKVKGRDVVIEFTKPHLAHAFNAIDVDHVPASLGFLNRYMNILRGVITQYSPEFALRNATRDSFTGFINIGIDFDVVTATKIVNPGRLAKGFGALRQYYRNGSFEGEWGQAMKAFRDNGSVSGWWQLNTVEERTKELQEAIDKGSFGQEFVKKGKEGGKAILNFMDDYNRSIENMVRLSAFKYLMDNKVENRKTKKPYTEQQAADYAKNLTVNFNRKGNWGNSIGSLFLFFNASVQGITRQLQPFIDGDTRTRVRASATPMVMAGTAYAFIEFVRQSMGTDDDDEYYYDKISEYTRTHNIIFPNLLSDDPGDYIKIPLPYGYNVYWAAGDVYNRIENKVIDWEEGALEMAVSSVDAFNPIGTGAGETWEQAAFKTVLPTVLQPGYELAINQDFAGRPIKPEPFPFAPETPQSQQYFNYVSNWSKITAEWLNEVSGGDKVIPGLVDVSPEHIEYLVEYFGGGSAKFINGIWATGENIVDDISGTDEFTNEKVYDVPFARSFYGKVTRNKDRSIFIEHADEIRQHISNYDRYMDLEGFNKANEYYKEHKNIIDLDFELKAVNKQLRFLRKEEDRYQGVDTEDARMMYKKIQTSQYELMKAFNKLYNERNEVAKSKSLSDIIK